MGLIDSIVALWKFDEQMADPRVDKADAESGYRKTPLLSCQYWLKGLSAVCSFWDGNSCTFSIPPIPSGYNNGSCDYLGRRSSCNKYNPSGSDDLEKYLCIAPNLFLSGLGKATGSVTTGYKLLPMPKDEITGYCEGRCDEQGRGTDCGGIPGTSPIVCTFYRPWQMGFGAVAPHELEKTFTDAGEVVITADAIEKAYGLIDTELGKRLPYSFKIYNLRAHMQKCANWDSDYGSSFEMGDNGVELHGDASTLCTSKEAAVKPYRTLATTTSLGINEWVLKNVWSQAHTVICNGAKPECPCYTGKWEYCIDDRMVTGMRISANQIFELRFYASPWDSQEEYDGVFAYKPNWQDVATSDIFTFDKWIRFALPSESIMQGNRLHICMPAPVNKREFDSDKYITKTPFQYAKWNINSGTTAPSEKQIYSPTLLRDIDVAAMRVDPIDIMYPYSSNDPFGSTYCEGDKDRKNFKCIKRGISLEGDSISVVGATIRYKRVYAINLNFFDDNPFGENTSISSISDKKTSGKNDLDAGLSQREMFYTKLEEFIEKCEKINPNYIYSGTSDSGGYFNIGPVPLDYCKENKIAICVYFASDRPWDFRIRKVLSKFYGGALVQTSFTYEGSPDNYEFMPEFFSGTGGATIGGQGFTFVDSAGGDNGLSPSCTLSEIKHVASSEYMNETGNMVSKYTYCIKKITKENVKVENWGSIGNNGLVWVEVDDKKINNIFEWDITSAKMIRSGDGGDGEDATDSSPICGSSDSEIKMKIKEIDVWESGKRSVPPSVCLLEPKDDRAIKFWNSDWNLEVSYWYKDISNDLSEDAGEEVIWPSKVSSGGFVGGQGFYKSNLVLSVDESSFTVTNVKDQTVALMGFFNDEEGRLVSCMASKMLVQVMDAQCRNVEIFYAYVAPAEGFRLTPETSGSNLAIKIGDERKFEVPPHAYKPFCGDHKLKSYSGSGPMWFPFDSCDKTDFYREFSNAAFCTEDFPETPRDDMRLCGPVEYKAWAEVGSSSGLARCVLPFNYKYSKAGTSDVIFTGYGNIIAAVNMLEYTMAGWTFPPFGNKGREMTERWFSQEHWNHVTYKNTTKPYVTADWVPVVPDIEHFFVSFNAFDEESGVSPDLFSHVSQFNFLISTALSEEVSSERLNFGEVFEMRGIWQATYPPPLIAVGDIQRVSHYCFKEADTIWVNREIWKLGYIEERKLLFVNYDQPDYLFDYEKKEHRYVCEEKEYEISYTAPLMQEGILKTFPSIRLEEGPRRYFEIRYDNYDSTQVTWKDEGGGGEASASSGLGGVFSKGNIYEKTSGTEWNHDENILFDKEAVETIEEAEDAGRKTGSSDGEGGFNYKYYNRGIIANITRDKLNYLPHEEKNHSISAPNIDEPTSGLGSFSLFWNNISPTLSYDLDFSSNERGGCITKITIDGKWGIYKAEDKSEFYVCLPGLIITSKAFNGEINTLYEKSSIAYNKEIYTDLKSKLKDYKFEIVLSPTVERMMNNQETEIYIKLNCADSQYIILNSMPKMSESSYKDDTETIDVYERKYIVSKGGGFGSPNINLNGPDRILQFQLEFDNSGVYYPISPDPNISFISDEPVQVKDKMRSIVAGKQYREDESIDISIGNIVSIEAKTQKELYSGMVDLLDSDIISYRITVAPSLRTFFNENNIPYLVHGSFISTCKRLEWEDHYIAKQHNSGGLFWQPKGHKFQWGGDVETNVRCYDDTPTGHYGASVGIINLEAILRFTLYEVVYLHLDDPTEPMQVSSAGALFRALFFNRVEYQIKVVAKFFEELPAAIEGGAMGLAALGSTMIDASRDTSKYLGS